MRQQSSFTCSKKPDSTVTGKTFRGSPGAPASDLLVEISFILRINAIMSLDGDFDSGYNCSLLVTVAPSGHLREHL